MKSPAKGFAMKLSAGLFQFLLNPRSLCQEECDAEWRGPKEDSSVMIHGSGDEREEEQSEGDEFVLDGLHGYNLLLQQLLSILR